MFVAIILTKLQIPESRVHVKEMPQVRKSPVQSGLHKPDVIFEVSLKHLPEPIPHVSDGLSKCVPSSPP